MNMTEENASYIGDGVYAGYDELGRIWLHTIGIHAKDLDQPTDKICLEPEVLDALIRFAKRVGMIKCTQ